MTDLTITHTPAEGTLLDGSSKGDGVLEILRAAPMNWRWSRNVGLYVRGSRDTPVPNRRGIERTAELLREAGHTVNIEYGDERRTPAEVEADRADRAEHRVETLTERAERKGREADAAWQAEHEILDQIPMGQPILVDHYSAPRHRRALDRAEGHRRRGSEAQNAAKDAEYGAAATEANQRHRESGPVTMRRIEKLQADLRDIQRRLDGYTTNQGLYSSTYAAATGQYREDLLARKEHATEQVEHWQAHLEQLERDGEHRVWTRADFTKGDFVKGRYGWFEVKRVNAKTVTVDHPEPRLAKAGYTWKVPYDEVQDRRAAAESDDLRAAVAAALASAG